MVLANWKGNYIILILGYIIGSSLQAEVKYIKSDGIASTEYVKKAECELLNIQFSLALTDGLFAVLNGSDAKGPEKLSENWISKNGDLLTKLGQADSNCTFDQEVYINKLSEYFAIAAGHSELTSDEGKEFVAKIKSGLGSFKDSRT